MTTPENQLFDAPRWPNGPHICVYENLPAFLTEVDAIKFHNLHGEAPTSIYEKWLCTVCKEWHYLANAPAPAGASSGLGRESSKIVPRYKREAKAT